jgi:hypothetical protein
MDELLALIEIDLRIIARESISGPADGKALFIQEAANLPNYQHVLALVIAAVAAAFHRLELWKFLFPIAQHVRLDSAQIADFANREVPLPRDWRQFTIIAWFQHMPIAWFQHMPRRGPSISGRAGR